MQGHHDPEKNRTFVGRLFGPEKYDLGGRFLCENTFFRDDPGIILGSSRDHAGIILRSFYEMLATFSTDIFRTQNMTQDDRRTL